MSDESADTESEESMDSGEGKTVIWNPKKMAGVCQKLHFSIFSEHN